MGRVIVAEALPGLHERTREILRGFVDVVTSPQASQDALIDAAHGAVALIARRVDLPYTIGSEVFDALDTVRVVSSVGSGADCYDIDAASARGIPVLHNPGVAPAPVVEYVLGSIVLLLRRLLDHSHYLRSGGSWADRLRYAGPEVSECSLGVVGMGSIGSEVARKAQLALGMRVGGFDPVASEEVFAAASAIRYESLADLLGASDVVSVHVPLSPSTHHLLGTSELALMKPTASLINTSRGPVVDQQALVAALQAGHLAGAVVDVFDPEPPPLDLPLLHMPQVLATPHCAGVSGTGGRILAEAVARNLLIAIAGQRPQHLVDESCWPPRRPRPADEDLIDVNLVVGPVV